jgi:hypothetical protein
MEFDEWKLVEKKGKRTADTVNLDEPKRPAHRDTPTRIKISKEKPARAKFKKPNSIGLHAFGMNPNRASPTTRAA